MTPRLQLLDFDSVDDTINILVIKYLQEMLTGIDSVGAKVEYLHSNVARGLSISLVQATQEEPDLSDPAVRRILFSKHFVPTYYLVVLAVVVIFSIRRWLVDRQRHGWTSSVAEADIYQNASLTTRQQIDDGVFQKYVLSTESSPLLTKALQQHNSTNRIARYFRSWLLYQPQPIRSVTAPVNVLPSNGTSLVVVLLIIINAFYLFYRNIPPYCGFDAFAIRAGLCCVMNIPVIYVLAAKNNYLLLRATGWSYDGLNIFHRRLAELMLVLACIHVMCMLGVWYTIFIPRGLSWIYFFRLRIIILGLSGLSCFFLIWITSTGYIRRKAYEVFLAVHVVAQCAFLVLVFLHHRNTRFYTGVALAIWVADRIAIRTCLSPKKYVATMQVAPDEETVLMHIDVLLDGKRHSSGFGCGWKPGQHIFISIPSLGLVSRYQRHPFTIASPAPCQAASTNITWPLQLIIRAKDGFSRKLIAFAKLHQHAEVLLDGPYGSPDSSEAVRRADRCAFIAGGSGISATYPLAWAVKADRNTKVLSNRITYRQGIKHIPQISVSTPSQSYDYYHLWINKDEKHQNWISLLPSEAQSKTTDGRIETNLDTQKALNLISRMCSTSNKTTGRPDVSAELSTWVRDCQKGHAATVSSKICVVVSGPNELAREVRNCVSMLVREGWDIEIIVEKFNW